MHKPIKLVISGRAGGRVVWRFRALLSRNTRRFEQAYRFTWFGNVGPLGHLELKRAEFDAMSRGELPVAIEERFCKLENVRDSHQVSIALS